MSTQTHILNGDALKMQLPDSIEAERFVMRECLVDGEVSGSTLQQFYQSRVNF